MSTSNPSSSAGQLYWYHCPPDAFAVFKRGDRALCLKGFGNSDWIISGGPPRTGTVYVVRDYHFGFSVTNQPGHLSVWGQILSLDGIVCDRVDRHPEKPEMGWYYGCFRKVMEEEAREAARASLTLAMGGAL